MRLALALALIACTRPSPTVTPGWQVDRSTFDPAGDPCTDFYQYACGGFATPAHVPADRDEAEWALDQASATNDREIQQLLAGTGPADPELGRLRTFFASCMADDRSADATLAAWLARLDAIETRGDVMAAVRALHREGVPALFDYAGQPDPGDRTRYRGELDSGALPWRIYVEPDRAADLAAYRAHVATMLRLAGVGDPDGDASAVFDLERALALAMPAPSDDPAATEHVMTADALAALAPHLDVPAYLAMVGYRPDIQLNVTSPAYLQAVDRAVAERPIGELRAYLRWAFVRALALELPPRLADERRRYLALPGVSPPPRTEQCQLETMKALGVELSRQFALHAIGRAARDRARPMADRVRARIARAVRSADWLSPAGREATARKLDQLQLKIGFPDAWPATGSFALRADAFLGNVLAARAYEQQRSWQRAGAARTRASWENIVYPNAAEGMAAARLTIPNGFPDPESNAIVFTAALLRPPLYDADAPPEVGYGAFGTVAGHEVIHVVEEHEFTATGQLDETWSPADLQIHEARRACVIDQAAGDQLDGPRMYSENVADLAGVRYAYEAMVDELGPRIAERGADGFTRAQRFFVVYAQHYCRAERPEFTRQNLRDDPHAPNRYRVNGPLSNLPAFAAAFQCRAGAAMVRRQACAVW